MTISKLWLIACMLVALPLLAANANAQNDEAQPSETRDATAAPLTAQAALSLTLSKTSIRTENNLLPLTTTSVAAFSTTTATCPATHTKGCTLKVEVSSQFWAIGAGNVAQANVTVSGAGLTVDPSSSVNVDSTSTGSLASVRTFQWMIRNVPAGSTQTVGINFGVNAGTANAGYRTATIGLYLN